eukprot:8165257-Pyramimonas_sp.AAC.1
MLRFLGMLSTNMPYNSTPPKTASALRGPGSANTEKPPKESVCLALARLSRIQPRRGEEAQDGEDSVANAHMSVNITTAMREKGENMTVALCKAPP